MAAGCVKSLQCRCSALDVYHPTPPSMRPPKPSPRPLRQHHDHHHHQQQPRHKKSKQPGSPVLQLGCGGDPSRALLGVVSPVPRHTLPKHPNPERPPPCENSGLSPPPPLNERPAKLPRNWSRRCQKQPKPRSSRHFSAVWDSSSPFLMLAELPAGHSPRRIVEIIFLSSWSPAGAAPEPFPGRVEMLFKVGNPPGAVTSFEEYREAVRSRAGPGDARCAADGNEMLRFHCVPGGPPTTPAGDPVYDAGIMCSFATSGGGILTFAGSGGAHAASVGAASGPGRRRAMMVSRVIAGRVSAGSKPGEFESASAGEGELLVFDHRAVLPCFLIIYEV